MINKLKRIYFFIALIFLFLTFVVNPYLAKAAPSNNPIFITFGTVQQMIADAINPLQKNITTFQTQLGNLESILNPIPSQISQLQQDKATQSAKIAELEQRIIDLENKPSPSPTPFILLNDDFNGPNLNQDIWDVFPNGGTYSLENGYIVIPGGSAIPFFRTKGNHFPDSQPFQVEFGIQYTSVAGGGDGVTLSFTQQSNVTPGWENNPISFWQDGFQNEGIKFLYFGNTAMLLGGVSFEYHAVKIVYDGEKYLGYLDGQLKYTSPPTGRAGGLWFGHPFYCCASGWAGFKLDYIKATLL